MRSSCLVWDGASGEILHRQWLIHWMGATGQAGFLFVPSSFPGLITAFKRTFYSSYIPPPPQNVCFKIFLLSQIRPIRFIYFQFCFLVLVAFVWASAQWILGKAGSWCKYCVNPLSIELLFSTTYQPETCHCWFTCLANLNELNIWVARKTSEWSLGVFGKQRGAVETSISNFCKPQELKENK